jgi:predicted peroxiredoxin
MKLGIMVTTDRRLDQVLGLAEAALRKGHAVSIFATDEGVRLLLEPQFAALAALPGASLSFCDFSARQLGVRPEGLPGGVKRGSQYENAVMAAEADKLIAL